MFLEKSKASEHIKSRQLREVMQRLANPDFDESWQRLDKLA